MSLLRFLCWLLLAVCIPTAPTAMPPPPPVHWIQMYVQHLAPVGRPAPSLLFFIPMAMPRNVE